MALRCGLPLALVLVLAACGGGGVEGLGRARRRDANGCTTVEQPKPTARKAAKPTTGLDPSKTYTVTMRDKLRQLHDRSRREDVAGDDGASFVSLARRASSTTRSSTGSCRASSSRAATRPRAASGGPGYSTVDKPPPTARYTLGIVAMAKTQPSRPAPAGSQFFIVTAQDAQLPPDYAILGHVVKGQTAVAAIGKLGDPATEQPTRERRDREGDRRRSTDRRGLVLAAGASSRYGGPSSASSCRRVLAALSGAAGGRDRRRRRARTSFEVPRERDARAL